MTARAEVLHGDCLDAMRRLAAEGRVFQSIVTDPPAGISFMNRAWDGDRGGRDQWIAWMRERAEAALALVPPGGHALVWALPRTSHWTATAWEDAGWGPPRDRIAHLFATGFPKSLDVGKALDRMAGAEREVVGYARETVSASARTVGVARGLSEHANAATRHKMFADPRQPITAPATEAAKQWAGWGTALKPAVEDWWLFRKPLGGMTVAECVQRHGTGAIHVGACRVAYASAADMEQARVPQPAFNSPTGAIYNMKAGEGRNGEVFDPGKGRWPANLCHDGSDEVEAAFAAFGERTSGKRQAGRYGAGGSDTVYGARGDADMPALAGSAGTASRFYFCAKANKRDRAGSKHPTCKSQSLMRYLVKLITPPGGAVLDPFAGSGSTLQAALAEGFSAVGIEREAEYVADIHRRLGTAPPAPCPAPPCLEATTA
jgi:site-specific DNA-methyltransferase (adenine-specific)